MGSIRTCYLMPHPPIIIPEIGGRETEKVKNTASGMKKIAENIESDKPDVILVITPHGPVFRDAICISTEKNLYGDFKSFNHKELKFRFQNDNDLVKSIVEEVNNEGVYVGEMDKHFAKNYGIKNEIDHGVLVPLYYVNKRYNDYKLIHLAIGMIPKEDLYKVGMAITKAVIESDKSVSVIASGDLSHRLTIEAPAGYDEKGKEFDRELVKKIKNKEVISVIDMDENLISRAGECGYRPVLILLGILDGFKYDTDILSYEGPFGVGYCNAVFKVGDKDKNRRFKEKIYQLKEDRKIKLRENESSYVYLARMTLESYVKYGNVKVDRDIIPQEMTGKKAGVFVSIKKDGQLRGCIGTTEPTQENIAYEIMNNAISAGTKDPRFSPIEEYELEDLSYSVDVLKQPEKINSIKELDIRRYGVIVQSGCKKGLLLPNLEGVDTPQQQVSIALQKAGIKNDEEYTMERFEVVRYK